MTHLKKKEVSERIPANEPLNKPWVVLKWF